MIKPMTAVRVSNLGRSLAFYNRQLGFEMLQRDDARDVAVIDVTGYAILLAGTGAGDLAPYLQDSHEVLPAAGTIHAFTGDLDQLRLDLLGRSLTDLEFVERWWGDRLLRVRDPDGHRVSFWTEIERTPEQVKELYKSGLEHLNDLIGVIEDSRLDLVPANGHWTIRQIIHHLVHSEMMSLPRILQALAEPGRVVRGQPYSQDIWVAELQQVATPVAPAVALLSAARHYVLDLLGAIPDGWSRTIRAEGGTEQRAGDIISMLAVHMLEHIEDIRDMLDGHATLQPSE